MSPGAVPAAAPPPPRAKPGAWRLWAAALGGAALRRSTRLAAIRRVATALGARAAPMCTCAHEPPPRLTRAMKSFMGYHCSRTDYRPVCKLIFKVRTGESEGVAHTPWAPHSHSCTCLSHRTHILTSYLLAVGRRAAADAAAAPPEAAAQAAGGGGARARGGGGGAQGEGEEEEEEEGETHYNRIVLLYGVRAQYSSFFRGSRRLCTYLDHCTVNCIQYDP